jgi:2-aminoadipate transaminase
LVTECLCDAGDIVLVEDPTYFVFLGIVQSHGLRTRGVRREPDGLGLVHLESVLESLRRAGELPRLKLLYLVSYHQNPTGTTTSFAKKLGALELLRHYEKLAGRSIYLLEDTAYRELGFGGEPAPSALAVPRFAQRVICAGTFTKPFATGARLGFGLLPKEVLTPVLRVKGNHDFGTASFLQHLLLRALQSGIYDRHLIQVRNRYARKAGVMAGVLRQHFPAAVHWREPSGGLYIWAALPRRTACDVKSRLFRRALAADVLYVPGRLCYAKDPVRRRPNHEMRLSFGSASETDIVTGVERLGQVIRETL